ncbi:Essential myosin light chain [Balamuthia mandrillaris]
MNHLNTKEEVIESFRVFDKEGRGSMSVAEFREILQELGEPMTPAEIDEMIYEADPRSTGQINYHQFVDMLFMYEH